MKTNTKAIQVGQEAEKNFGAVIPPIYMNSTYQQEYPGKYNKYDYTRAGNPNFTNFEEAISSLENGKFATAFGSGLGGLTALMSTLNSGDKIIVNNDLYGGTFRALNFFKKWGIGFELFDLQNIAALEEHLSKNKGYKAILVETPTNPLLTINDIKGISKTAKKNGLNVWADNTFASPINQQPLDLGADVVWHSSTKYIGGHSDLVGGVLITNDEALKEEFDFARKALGLNPSPMDVWLFQRSIKTLPMRIKQHNYNAEAFAKYFDKHSKVNKVFHPSLATHKNHEIAKSQMKGYGGMLSIEFKMSLEDTMKLISKFRVLKLAESLGGIESLVNHPATMTHTTIPRETRIANGLNDGLVRFSIGCEDIDDLIEDVENQLKNF